MSTSPPTKGGAGHEMLLKRQGVEEVCFFGASPLDARGHVRETPAHQLKGDAASGGTPPIDGRWPGG
eukprot:3389279-Lingulodinium_polyedra.AAC.1